MVVLHTTKAIARRWAARVHLGIAEILDHLFFRILAGGRVPPIGMRAFLDVGELSWHQATILGAAQRARRAFGRVKRRNDCTILYCGWPSELRRGNPLPVFVLLDRTWRVREIAYAHEDDGQVYGLSPGIGPNLQTSTTDLVAALRMLAQKLEIEDFDDQLPLFTGG